MKNKFPLLIMLGLFLFLMNGCEKKSHREDELESNGTGIFIYDVVNKTNKQITHTPDVIGYGYQFFHHRQSILYSTKEGGFYMNIDGSGKGQWIDTLVSPVPDLSPDDHTIVYSLNKNLYLVNPDGTNRRKLTYDDMDYEFPKWSPDGQKIACYNRSGLLYLVTLDGQVKSLSRTGGVCNWSPDSKSLIYHKFTPKEGIYKFDLVANIEVQLTTLQNYSVDPVFNPVNEKICFAENYYSDLMIMNPDGTNQKSILHRSLIKDPCWSPDGDHLTFILAANVGICDADGNNLKIINQEEGGCAPPFWSNDGKNILYFRSIVNN